MANVISFPDPREFICDCSPTFYSCYGGLVFDSLGKLVGIGFQHFGPVTCFQVDHIQELLQRLSPGEVLSLKSHLLCVCVCVCI